MSMEIGMCARPLALPDIEPAERQPVIRSRMAQLLGTTRRWSMLHQTPWAATEAVTLGTLRVTYAGIIYVCVTAGTTSSTDIDRNRLLVADGTVSWRYVSRYNSRKAEFASVPERQRRDN